MITRSLRVLLRPARSTVLMALLVIAAFLLGRWSAASRGVTARSDLSDLVHLTTSNVFSSSASAVAVAVAAKSPRAERDRDTVADASVRKSAAAAPPSELAETVPTMLEAEIVFDDFFKAQSEPPSVVPPVVPPVVPAHLDDGAQVVEEQSAGAAGQMPWMARREEPSVPLAPVQHQMAGASSVWEPFVPVSVPVLADRAPLDVSRYTLVGERDEAISSFAAAAKFATGRGLAPYGVLASCSHMYAPVLQAFHVPSGALVHFLGGGFTNPTEVVFTATGNPYVRNLSRRANSIRVCCAIPDGDMKTGSISFVAGTALMRDAVQAYSCGVTEAQAAASRAVDPVMMRVWALVPSSRFTLLNCPPPLSANVLVALESSCKEVEEGDPMALNQCHMEIIDRHAQRHRMTLLGTALVHHYTPTEVLNGKCPRFYLCVMTMMRDVAHRAAEWLFYLKRIGVEHVVVYDNLSKDGLHARVLESFVREGFVTLVDAPVSFQGPWDQWQRASVTDCLRGACRLCDWTMLLDVDEFPVVVSNEDSGSLARLLQRIDEETRTGVRPFVPAVRMYPVVVVPAGAEQACAGATKANFVSHRRRAAALLHGSMLKQHSMRASIEMRERTKMIMRSSSVKAVLSPHAVSGSQFLDALHDAVLAHLWPCPPLVDSEEYATPTPVNWFQYVAEQVWEDVKARGLEGIEPSENAAEGETHAAAGGEETDGNVE
jgi:hypothetical protein